MRKLFLLAGLGFALSCQSLKPITAASKPVNPYRTIYVVYNDGVRDSIRTKFSYPLGTLTYLNECSCDATVLK